MTDAEDTAKAIERIRLELVTRRFMVVVLALIGVWVGIAMCFTGAPDFLEQWFSPWSRYAIGGIAFATGLTVSLGAVLSDQRPSGWWTQVAGLTGLTLWYVGMAVAYVVVLLQHGGPHFASPGQPLDPESTGRAYVPLVYAGLVVMTATPLVTMVRLKYSRKTP